MNNKLNGEMMDYQTYQEAMQHHHPAPTSIWRVLILDLFLFLLLRGHGILSEQVHGCLGFTGREKKNITNNLKLIYSRLPKREDLL